MADEADRGNEMADRHLELALKAHRVKHAVSEDCEECGKEIPPARQEATGGTDLCIDCARIADEKSRRNVVGYR